ncbi:hypothetical protein [Pararhodobacter aggregans]|uniref:hypothetical protein n=1 Tax=Pararhodobacter aggregans TaxID=404875 RepID=UPI001057A5CD|nr:hypothetical protein [Pararhodobacter aggregans]
MDQDHSGSIRKDLAMNTRAETDIALLASPPRSGALPAGAGILLAVILGGLIWVGLFALLT